MRPHPISSVRAAAFVAVGMSVLVGACGAAPNEPPTDFVAAGPVDERTLNGGAAAQPLSDIRLPTAAAPTPPSLTPPEPEPLACLGVPQDPTYGFEIKFCPADLDPLSNATLDALLAGVDDVELAGRLARVATALDEMDAACNLEPAAWRAAIDRAAAAIEELAAVAGADPDALSDFRGTERAAAINEAIRNRMAFQVGCQNPSTGEEEPIAVEPLVDSAGRAVAALDELYAITADVEPLLATQFWLNADHLGHVLELRRFVDDARVDVAIVGNTTAVFAFDPEAVSEAAEIEAVNLSIRGLDLEATALWVDQLVAITGTSTVVLGVASHELAVRPLFCNTVPAVATVEQSAGRASATFGPIAGLRNAAIFDRLLGPATDPSYGSTVALDAFAAVHPGWRQGRAADPDAGDEETDGEAEREAMRRQLELPECQGRVQAVESLATTLADADIRLIVVGLPISPTIAELHPDGIVGHDGALDALLAAASAGGAEVIDLRDELGADDFVDLTRVTPEGAVAISEIVAAAL